MSREPASHARTRNYARVQRERDERTHERRMGRPPRRIPFDLRHLSVRSHVITRNFVRSNVARTVLAVHFGSFWPGRLSKSPPLPRTANYPLTPPSCSDVTISAVHQEFVSRSSPPFSFLLVFYQCHVSSSIYGTQRMGTSVMAEKGELGSRVRKFTFLA